MSTARERTSDDAYEAQHDAFPGDKLSSTADAAEASHPADPAYLTSAERNRKAGTTAGPQVVADDKADLGMLGVDGAEANSDAMLERDEKDAIDSGNILQERTRHATKPEGTYREPGDEEGLPGRGETGRSNLRGVVTE